MGRRRVLIAATDDRRQAAQDLQRQLSRMWGPAVEMECVDLAAAPNGAELKKTLKKFSAGVLLLNGAEAAPSALALIDAAELIGVPVVVLRDEAPSSGTFAGVLAMSVADSPEAITAALDALMHSGDETRRLRAELSLATRCSGGLEGEIVKMHEELQLAAMVQRELLPRELPSLHNVSFGTLWRPAHYVSGDIFDVARLDEDHIGVFLTDAVGHGVPAALLTMVISRSLVMKEVVEGAYHILPPSEVLGRLNEEMILRQGRSTRFATAVYALIDCRRRVMQLAGAGHPPPLLLRHSRDEMTPLETQGGLLGIFEGERYEHIEIELEADDSILFYSDGFEQAFPTGASDDHERRMPTTRYRSEFEAIARAGSPQDCIDELCRRLDTQAGSLHQADDLTLICAHAGPLVGGYRKAEVSGQRSDLTAQRAIGVAPTSDF